MTLEVFHLKIGCQTYSPKNAMFPVASRAPLPVLETTVSVQHQVKPGRHPTVCMPAGDSRWVAVTTPG